VASADLRAAYFASKQSAYAEMIDLLVQLHDRGGPADLLARALEVEERSRSRSLLDVLASRRDGLLRGAGADVLADERRVVRTFSFKSQQLAQLPDKPDSAAQRATLLSEVDGLQTEYDRLEGVIAEKEPRQAALATVPPLTIDGIRALLDPDTVLLEFALGGESSYLWVVGAGDLACFRLPGRAAIEALPRPVASLAGDRATRLAQPAVERRFRSAAAGLSRRLAEIAIATTLVAGVVPGVPANAMAVTGNLTVTQATVPGFVSLGSSIGASSTINFKTGDSRANGVTLGLASDGSLSALYSSSTGKGSVHLIFDLTGYFLRNPGGAIWLIVRET